MHKYVNNYKYLKYACILQTPNKPRSLTERTVVVLLATFAHMAGDTLLFCFQLYFPSSVDPGWLRSLWLH